MFLDVSAASGREGERLGGAIPGRDRRAEGSLAQDVGCQLPGAGQGQRLADDGLALQLLAARVESAEVDLHDLSVDSEAEDPGLAARWLHVQVKAGGRTVLDLSAAGRVGAQLRHGCRGQGLSHVLGSLQGHRRGWY